MNKDDSCIRKIKTISKSPIVIYRLGSMGDMLVALPCFHKITEFFLNRKKIILTNFPISNLAAPAESILKSSGLIDGVIEYPLNLRSLRGLINLRSKLRLTGANTMIYLASPRSRLTVFRDLIFFRLCGFSQIIGAPLRSDVFNNRVDPKSCLVEPESKRLIRALKELGTIDVDNPRNWSLALTHEELMVGSNVLARFKYQKYLAINMGGKEVTKDWGQDKWKNLIMILATKLEPTGLIIIGAREDRVRGDSILNFWPYTGLNLCGELSPRESASVLSNALLFIGHDSGPLHLAASMQIPVIGLFGSFNEPNKWHPHGAKNIIIHKEKGMSYITEKEVVEAILTLLGSTIVN